MIKKIVILFAFLSMLGCSTIGLFNSAKKTIPTETTEVSVSGYSEDILPGTSYSEIPVPAFPGEGKTWELREEASDDFRYQMDPPEDKVFFGDDKWYNFYHNPWDGPGTTHWRYDMVTADGENLVITAVRSENTHKMGVRGIKTGCVTSTNRVVYPVYIETSMSVADIALASDFWLLSPDDTQEIDVIECYGGAYNGNEYFSHYIHISHHSFIREPFTDYQPRDRGAWWYSKDVENWGQYSWNDGDRQFVQVGVNWVSPFHFEYYVDGELVRVLYDKSLANKLANGNWSYEYPLADEDGNPLMDRGYQKTQIIHQDAEPFNFDMLMQANKKSEVSIIDPFEYQGGEGFYKPMDIIINVESQNWHVTAGRTPSDEHLADPTKNQMLVDWVRVYKPVATE